MTWRPPAAMHAQSGSSHHSIDPPEPMISSTVGSAGSPKASVHNVTPPVCTIRSVIARDPLDRRRGYDARTSERALGGRGVGRADADDHAVARLQAVGGVREQQRLVADDGADD